ncbi:MAG: hypothetical protein LBU25_02205, partial [Treponema sp.]|nr:hypothetical protein [Treponema sp.]
GNAAGLLEGLSSAYFREIQAGLEPARGKLRLPRFSIEGEVMSFKEILLGLDIPLFETGSLLGVLDTPLPVQLSDALHKAVIRVDEKGTTAAAVTLLLIGASSAGPQEPPEKTFEMNCNKPFVFVLCDRGEQVVFTGMVNTP